MSSRWADAEEDAALIAQRKRDKEAKKRLKAEKARKAEEAAEKERRAALDSTASHDDSRPSKRRRLSHDDAPSSAAPAKDNNAAPRKLIRFNAPGWQAARTINDFDLLNAIEEGSYGWVSRAREKKTGDVVAIKKLKMEVPGTSDFPVTALREIQTLNAAKHKHVVDLREVIVKDKENADEVWLVMDFLEHDLKTLMEGMSEPFLPSEVKTLMLQLGSAVEFLHEHWILHRDLKTSNILMNNRGEIKIADFGMARFVGDPPPSNLTQLVVTLWYRSPELLLGTTTYGNAVDIWSIGCIFAELLTNEPLLQGKNEVDQLSKIFDLCGIPDESSWPGFRRLPNAPSLRLPANASRGANIRGKFPFLTNAGNALLSSLLSLNPARRPSASELLAHSYFKEDPRPKNTAMFPTFPSKAGQERRRKMRTPNAPTRGEGGAGKGAVDFSNIFAGRDDEEQGGGFSLKMG